MTGAAFSRHLQAVAGAAARHPIERESPLQRLTIRRPDDWHLHLRDGAMLEAVLPWSVAHFARAIVMPNLVPPLVTGADAREYRDRIVAATPDGACFRPLMTLYLTGATDPDDLIKRKKLCFQERK